MTSAATPHLSLSPVLPHLLDLSSAWARNPGTQAEDIPCPHHKKPAGRETPSVLETRGRSG